MRPAIAVFAKAPIPGRVKTRLAAHLGPLRAAELYREMVSVLVQRLSEASVSLATDIEVHTDTPLEDWPPSGVTGKLQISGDLGVRMRHALDAGLAEGRSVMMIVGGDVPTVPVEHLRQLLAADADVALGPAEDGGYYAIACRRTHPEMFLGVEWSTGRACEQTAAACRKAGLTVFLGAPWFDIDEPSDLARI